MKKFLHSDVPHGNVVFNFRRDAADDLSAFARGYHTAGKNLRKNLEASVGYRDYDGYPILFLYRHALELFLKAIVYKGAKVVKLISDQDIDTSRLFRNHQLSSFLPAIEAIFNDLEWEWEQEVSGLTSFADFAELIHEIETIDRSSYTFRYPVTTTGDAALEQHFVINVIEFGKVLDPILELLDGAVTALHHEWDIAADTLYKLQKIIKGV